MGHSSYREEKQIYQKYSGSKAANLLHGYVGMRMPVKPAISWWRYSHLMGGCDEWLNRSTSILYALKKQADLCFLLHPESKSSSVGAAACANGDDY